MKLVERIFDIAALLEPTVYEDSRGSFFESFNAKVFSDLTGFEGSFVQDNQSTSTQDVLRGIHYQLPNPQGKLVRCVDGAIWDVLVDLRRSSPTFGEWQGYELTAMNRLQLWIPEGFGHGFVALSESATVAYKTTAYFDPESDRSIRWDDPDLAVDWPLGSPILSEKDCGASGLNEAHLFE